ncbi:hypothetical protein A2892_02030 [Candidatus Woesebacteria bacterium RIFCSPLOWO2_01_FULL_39_10b]|uniref:DUF3048 domain-containing protein n=1 Tax=Candidatus Woesebacteria bacterium RIFCSPLOWO2_01_FULL_39_10b TaxID=1802517 RepID=A0A1F8BA34_9BACT|nr:MAG: hypothetical protein A2892_02030 [Candidatus Woesebacteria bacterium RIFCSPLOWO2_01_FULL_39_10b]
MEKVKNLILGKKAMLVLSFLGLFLLSLGSSWAFFSFLKKEPLVPKEVEKGRARIDPNLPKDEECPINGKMFSKPEKVIWEERRPITAVIENHLDSRSQSGLSKADLIYEAVAEGGITRFLAVYYCGASAEDVKIAPIRSIRVYFIDWASEFGNYPLLVHSGGANNICNNCPGGVKYKGEVAPEVDAFKRLVKLGWRSANGNAMDAGTNLGYPAVKRDQYRLGTKSAWEHSFEGYTDKIFEEAKKRGFGYKDSEGNAWDENFTVWKFIDEKPVPAPNATEISFKFWDGMVDYDVGWKYDLTGNHYLRFNGGKEHQDFETKIGLIAKNVVVQFVKEKGPVDKEKHMFYTTVGEGKALIFQNGDVIEGIWKKDFQSSRTKFFDKKGKEIGFIRGVIWIEAIPFGSEVVY